MTIKFHALRINDTLPYDQRLDFECVDNPVCPHCGSIYNIHDHEAWELYNEGDYDIECGGCDLEFNVVVGVIHHYTTLDQEGYNE